MAGSSDLKGILGAVDSQRRQAIKGRRMQERDLRTELMKRQACVS